MQSQIISLNVSHPVDVSWNGRSVRSSMHKKPVELLNVSKTDIEGDSFDYKGHGTPDSVLYALALSSIESYVKQFGRKYTPGDLGENLTLDHFDETLISAGDIFQIGQVVAQATFPRIPCGKVNMRMQNATAQKKLMEHGRSGVYFRILNPGVIKKTDSVKLLEKAQHRVLISDLYNKINAQHDWSQQEVELLQLNGAVSKHFMDKFR